jgi:hypothetical protein
MMRRRDTLFTKARVVEITLLTIYKQKQFTNSIHSNKTITMQYACMHET